MQCSERGIDTAPEIIEESCFLFYYPNDTGSARPCKYFTKCQRRVKRLIEMEDEPRELHRKYMEGRDG